MNRRIISEMTLGIAIGYVAITASGATQDTTNTETGKANISATGASFTRPSIPLEDAEAKAFHDQWQDCITRADYEGILAARTSDYKRASIEINTGVMPWITDDCDAKQTNYVTAGGLIQYREEHYWLNPRQSGTASVSVVRSPPWPELATAAGFTGWLRTTDGGNLNLIRRFVWIRVPKSFPIGTQQSFQTITMFNGPPDDEGSGSGIMTNTYQLAIVDVPPDQAAIINLWAYTINNGSDDGTWLWEKKEDSIKRITALDNLLRGFRGMLNEKDRELLDKLLSHPTYDKRVLQHMKSSGSIP